MNYIQSTRKQGYPSVSNSLSRTNTRRIVAGKPDTQNRLRNHNHPPPLRERMIQSPLLNTLPDPSFFPPGTPGSFGLEQPANMPTDVRYIARFKWTLVRRARIGSVRAVGKTTLFSGFVSRFDWACSHAGMPAASRRHPNIQRLRG